MGGCKNAAERRLEDNTLDGLRMATSVVEIKRRTVRSAIQHELRIAERGTYVVQIVGGQAARVQAQIGLRCQVLAARAHDRIGPQLAEIELGMCRGRKVALQRSRFSRAAIVDEQYIVAIAERRKCARRRIGKAEGQVRSRTAGIEDDRAVCGAASV